MTNIAVEIITFIVDFPIKSMVIFHSYVSLPEGNLRILSYLSIYLPRYYLIVSFYLPTYLLTTYFLSYLTLSILPILPILSYLITYPAYPILSYPSNYISV
jgi:hypothetical protein